MMRVDLIWIRLLASYLALTTSIALAQGKPAEREAQEEQAFKQAAALAAPSLVRIETIGGLERVGQILTGTGPTTGVVLTADGFIISSSFNFVAKPASILITLFDGRRLPARQIALDKVKMLTLLKVEAENLVPARPAPRESFAVGQWALALGRTFEETPSISVGIVSALGRIWGKAMQTDAKVSPVNYGGALADIEGRVLGILVPLDPQASGDVAGVEWYDSGIGFAIPLVDVYATLDRLKEGHDLLPGLMGITIKGQDIYEGEPTIDRVRYASPAQQAGFKEGDVIVELDGKRVQRQAQLKHVLGNKYAGETVAMTAKRGEERISADVTLVEKLIPYESAYLGVLPVRAEAGRPLEAGASIRYVFADSPAAAAGLARGERIIKWNDDEIATPAALLDLVSRKRPGEKVRLTVAPAEGAAAPRAVEVTLGKIPAGVPLDLRPAPMTSREKELADKSLQLGHFTEKMPAHEHEYWAYVPDDYNPDYQYGLLIWLHPGGDTMEAAMLKAWQTLCNERGMILLAPKAKQIAGWTPDELEFVKDAVEEFQKKYSIDKARVVLHAFGNGGIIASQLAFKHRALFHGLALAGTPLGASPPDNEPDFRLQFHFTSSDNDPLHRGVVASVRMLGEMKFPVVHTIVTDGGHKYPPQNIVTEIAVWADLLDRI